MGEVGRALSQIPSETLFAELKAVVGILQPARSKKYSRYQKFWTVWEVVKIAIIRENFANM